MNLKEYISSGILESYALGAVSPQEMQEVECMSHIYPEIAEELERIQLSIEMMASGLAQTPPPESLDFIMEAIEDVPQETASPAKETKVVAMPSRKPAASSGAWKNTALAACVLGLLGLGVWLFSTHNKLQNTEASFLAVQAELEETNEAQSQLTASLNDQRLQMTLQQTQLSVLKAEETRRIVLNGTDNAPDARADVFWNPTMKMAFIQANALPVPPTAKQYQLWAIVDGEPVDMGVFNLDPTNPDLQRVADVANAQAFAITVEPIGGSVSPSLDTMVVIGTV